MRDVAGYVRPVRLNKFISETGACSRREADDWIAAGRGTIHGQPAGGGSGRRAWAFRSSENR